MNQQELFERNTALAYRVAWRWARTARRYGASMDEISNAALWGLWIAAKRFDPTKGFAFSTFAWTCVENEISRYFRQVYQTRRKNRPRFVRIEAAVKGESCPGLERVEARDEARASFLFAGKR